MVISTINDRWVEDTFTLPDKYDNVVRVVTSGSPKATCLNALSEILKADGITKDMIHSGDYPPLSLIHIFLVTDGMKEYMQQLIDSSWSTYNPLLVDIFLGNYTGVWSNKMVQSNTTSGVASALTHR